jgi:hypothetical protein
MRRRAILTVFAIVVVAAAAFSTSEPVEARVPAAGVQVQLLDPGTKPRAVLRIMPSSAPTSRTLTLSNEVTQSGVASATIGPLQIRTVVSTMARLAGPKGTIRVPYVYGRFQLLDTSAGTPQELDAIRTSLAQFQGFSGEFTLSSTGTVLSNRLNVPSTVNATVRSFLQQLSNESGQLTVPLPTQAVGIGARWRGTTQLAAGGLNFHQTYDYTLRSRDSGRLALDVRYIQTAPRQRFRPPGLASGVTVEVTNFRIAGMGVSVLDLSQAIPLSGHLAAQGVEELRVRQGRQSATVNQHVQLGIDLASG